MSYDPYAQLYDDEQSDPPLTPDEWREIESGEEQDRREVAENGREW